MGAETTGIKTGTTGLLKGGEAEKIEEQRGEEVERGGGQRGGGKGILCTPVVWLMFSGHCSYSAYSACSCSSYNACSCSG